MCSLYVKNEKGFPAYLWPERVAPENHWAPVCPLQRAATLDLGTTMFPTSVFIKHVPAGHNKKMWSLAMKTLSDHTVWNHWSISNTSLLSSAVPCVCKLQIAATQEKQVLHVLLGRTLKRGWAALWGTAAAHGSSFPMWVRLRAACSCRGQGAGQAVDQARFLWWPPQPLWWDFLLLWSLFAAPFHLRRKSSSLLKV